MGYQLVHLHQCVIEHRGVVVVVGDDLVDDLGNTPLQRLVRKVGRCGQLGELVQCDPGRMLPVQKESWVGQRKFGQGDMQIPQGRSEFAAQVQL